MSEPILDDNTLTSDEEQSLHLFFWLFLFGLTLRIWGAIIFRHPSDFVDILAIPFSRITFLIGVLNFSSDTILVLAGLAAFQQKAFHTFSNTPRMNKYFILFFIGAFFKISHLLFHGIAPDLFETADRWVNILFRIPIVLIPWHYYRSIYPKAPTPYLFRIPFFSACACGILSTLFHIQSWPYATVLLLTGGALFSLSFLGLYIAHSQKK
jgi:hypothetical protein